MDLTFTSAFQNRGNIVVRCVSKCTAIIIIIIIIMLSYRIYLRAQ